MSWSIEAFLLPTTPADDLPKHLENLRGELQDRLNQQALGGTAATATPCAETYGCGKVYANGHRNGDFHTEARAVKAIATLLIDANQCVGEVRVNGVPVAARLLCSGQLATPQFP